MLSDITKYCFCIRHFILCVNAMLVASDVDGGVLHVQQVEEGIPRCGLCGDPDPGPRAHEKGGEYGTAMISRYYPAATKGKWWIELCIHVFTFTYHFLREKLMVNFYNPLEYITRETITLISQRNVK